MKGVKRFGIIAEIKRYCKKLASDLQGFIKYVSQRVNELRIFALIENDYGVNFPFPAFLIETKISRG